MDSDCFPRSLHGRTVSLQKRAAQNNYNSPSRRTNKLSADAITRKYCQNFRPRNSLCNGHGPRSPTRKSVAAQENVCREQEKGVKFSSVTVYSFTREQGFSSIPDSGWCTLGMAQKHFSVSRFDLHQHRILQRLRRRQRRLLSQKNRLANGTIQGRMRCRGKARLKAQPTNSEFSSWSTGDSCRVPVFSSPPPLSPQQNQDRFTHMDVVDNSFLSIGVHAQATPPPPCLSPPSPRRFLGSVDESLVNSTSFTSFDTLDTDSEASLDHIPSISSPGRLRNGRTREKLMPIHPAARIRLLRSSGVTQLDESERLVCSFVRATRARVGCSCGPKHPCIPEHCSCSQDGVPCQVDRESFPCSCMANKCYNPNGRNEFLRDQVRAHAQHVLTRFSQDSIAKNSEPTVHEPALSLGFRSPASISSPIPNQNTNIFSTPSGACPICVTVPISTSAKVSLFESSPSNTQTNSASTNCVNGTPSISRSTRTPMQKRKSEYAPSPDCTHSTPLVQTDLSIRTDLISSKLFKINEFVGLDLSNPASPSNTYMDPKLISTEGPRSPLPLVSEIRSSPTRTGLRERTVTPSKELGTTKSTTSSSTRRIDSPNSTTSPTVSTYPYIDPILNTSPMPDASPLAPNSAIRRLATSSSRTKSQSLSDTSDIQPSSPKLRSTRMRKSSSAENIQASDLYILTNDSELLSDYPGTPPALSTCDSPVLNPEFHHLRVNFPEDPIATNHRTDSLKDSWPISKQNLFTSKSAPNSPRPDQNIHFGRISLRHRAIPRLPVTPSRRVIRSPRQANINSGVKTVSRLLFSQDCRSDGLISPHEPISTPDQLISESDNMTIEPRISNSDPMDDSNHISQFSS